MCVQCVIYVWAEQAAALPYCKCRHCWALCKQVVYLWMTVTKQPFIKHPAEGLMETSPELCSLEWHVPIPACVWDLGHVIHFPSPAIRPHIPRPGYFSTRDSTPFPECRRFYCFSLLIFFFFPMQLNKRFLLSFLHAQGKLFTRIG